MLIDEFRLASQNTNPKKKKKKENPSKRVFCHFSLVISCSLEFAGLLLMHLHVF